VAHKIRYTENKELGIARLSEWFGLGLMGACGKGEVDPIPGV